MLPTPRFKIAFIGSHGVGKTTLCYGLAARLKRRDVGIEVVHEVARRCPLPINEETSVAAQSWILHTQIAEELVAQARYPVVVCDRSVLDNYVYLLLAAGRQEGPERLVEHWLRGYDLLVHVPIVEDLEPRRRPLARSGVPAGRRGALVQEIAERRAPRPAARSPRRAGWLDAVERAAWERLRPAQLSLSISIDRRAQRRTTPLQ